MELVDFLRARLDEDEAIARVLLDDKRPGRAERWEFCDDGAIRDTGRSKALRVKFTWPPEAEHIIRHDPARVLAEVEAKRDLLAAILAEPHATLRPGGSTAIYCAADSDLGEPCECGRDVRAIQYVRLLASPYRDHPDFDPAWLEG